MPTSSLPVEILIHIFGYLSFSDHVSASHVCTNWQTIISKTPSLLPARYLRFRDASNEPIGVHELLFASWYAPSLPGVLCCSIQNSKILGYEISSAYHPGKESEGVTGMQDNNTTHGAEKIQTPSPRKDVFKLQPDGLLNDPCIATDWILKADLIEPRGSFVKKGHRLKLVFWSAEKAPQCLPLEDGDEIFPILFESGYPRRVMLLDYVKVRFRSEKEHERWGITIKELMEVLVESVEKKLEELEIDVGKVHFLEIEVAHGRFVSDDCPERWFLGHFGFRAMVLHPDSLIIKERLRKEAEKIEAFQSKGTDGPLGLVGSAIECSRKADALRS
ncbi:hypothetical protein TWF730_009335 [Orbilia blumenaviensis]|uniref:F-box domain-containing protein n=1 Tax=Orbilia blumenaviensis TaxID=1796055 RepID=A0AAV9UY00_9PEZI